MNLNNFKIPTLDEVNHSIARKSHLEVMRHTWGMSTPFLTVFHTEKISEWIDQAFEKYKRGQSSYALVSLHHRSGKSQLISRSAVPHFLGENPEGEVITTSYNTQTVQKFSKDAKTLIESPAYQQLYPDVRLDPDNRGIGGWGLDNRIGGTLWSGIDGSLTGSGANFAIVDDAFKGRAEANSPVICAKRWESFTESFMTRLAPVHIVLVVATRWSENDLHGKIETEMEENPLFPHFDKLIFPAKAEDYTGDGEYHGKYLFPERFSDAWYEGQYEVLGKFGASALLDCSPKIKGGNIIPCEKDVNWRYITEKPEGFGRLFRSWDLASTKQNAGNDPDYTVGIKGAIKVEITKIINPATRKIDKLKMVSIYIEDIVRMRDEAVKRNEKMIWTAHNDGAGCVHFVESFGAQKDTVVTLKAILGGSRIVKGVRHKGDKDYKVTEALEVPFSSGNVFVNKRVSEKLMIAFQEEAEGFPFATHDDLLDALANMVNELTTKAYNSWWVTKPS